MKLFEFIRMNKAYSQKLCKKKIKAELCVNDLKAQNKWKMLHDFKIYVPKTHSQIMRYVVGVAETNIFTENLNYPTISMNADITYKLS